MSDVQMKTLIPGIESSGERALLTIPEAAEATRLSVAWWRAAVFKRRVRHVRLFRRVLIPKVVIEEMVRAGTVEPRKTGESPV